MESEVLGLPGYQTTGIEERDAKPEGAPGRKGEPNTGTPWCAARKCGIGSRT